MVDPSAAACKAAAELAAADALDTLQEEDRCAFVGREVVFGPVQRYPGRTLAVVGHSQVGQEEGLTQVDGPEELVEHTCSVEDVRQAWACFACSEEGDAADLAFVVEEDAHQDRKCSQQDQGHGVRLELVYRLYRCLTVDRGNSFLQPS